MTLVLALLQYMGPRHGNICDRNNVRHFLMVTGMISNIFQIYLFLYIMHTA